MRKLITLLLLLVPFCIAGAQELNVGTVDAGISGATMRSVLNTNFSNIKTVVDLKAPLTGTAPGLTVGSAATVTGFNRNDGTLTLIGNHVVTLTTTGTTNVTLPTTGTLMTNPMTASGDLIYGGVSGVPTRLAAGIDGYVLTLSNGVPVWATPPAGGNGGSITYPGAGIAVSTGSAWTTSISDNSSNWNTAYGWGNHASAGYYVGTSTTIRQLLSSSATGLTYNNSTGVFSLTDGYSIPANASITNWNTAFGWGDHSDAGYVDEATAEGIVGGVLDDMLEDAPIGVAVEDVVGGTTGRNRYMSPAQIESYVALHGGGGGSFSGGERIKFTIGDLGAPVADDNSFSHSALAGKQIVLLRDGIESDYTYAAGEITVIPNWQENEKIRLYLWPWGTWEDLSLDTSIEQGLINSLVGYWKYNEGSGSTVADELGQQELNLYGTLPWTSGMYSSSGVRPKSDVVSRAAKNTITPSGPFSIALWFKLDSLGSEGDNPHDMYFYSVLNETPSKVTTISLRVNGDGANQDYFEYSVRNSAGSWAVLHSNVIPSKDIWSQVVITFPETEGYMKIYLNGEDVSASNVTFSGTFFKSDSFTHFGSWERWSTSYVRGSIDEAMYFDRALTLEEVEYLWDDGNGRQLTIE